MPYELRYYQTSTGKVPLRRWLKKLEDRQIRARLAAGDKRTQQRDIERAKEYFKDYKARPEPGEAHLSAQRAV